MKKTHSLLIALFITTALSAQFKPLSGDSDLDNVLIDLNNNVKNDIKTFTEDMASTFGLPVPKISDLLNIHHMQPSDVVMTLQLAQQTSQPIETVATNYDKNKSKGWGVIAKEMGIKPGSKEFHALKDSAKGKSAKAKGKSKGKGNSGNSGDNEGGHGKGKGKGKK